MAKISETPADVKVQVQVETLPQNVESPTETLRTGSKKMALFLLRCFFVLGFCAVVIFILLVLGNRQEEIKSELTQLKTQITSLYNKHQKELNVIRHVLNQTSFLINAEHDKGMNQTLLVPDQNQEKESIQNQTIAEPSTGSSPSSPRFFLGEQYKEAWYEPAPGWETECVNMPSYMDEQASSIQLRGNCLLICPGRFCSKAKIPAWKHCLEIHPNSYGLDDLEKIEYNNLIRSFRLCSTTAYSKFIH